MYKIKVNEQHTFELLAENDALRLHGEDLQFDVREIKDGLLHFLYQNRSYTAEIISEDHQEKKMVIRVNGNLYHIDVEDQFDSLLKAMGMNGAAGKQALEIKAPMPGLVLSVNVTEGQEVKKGDNLLVLEAMKMENMLKSATEGVVKKIFVGKGDKVEKNQVLIEFE